MRIGIEDQAVLADLHLVAAGERRVVDAFPVDVGAVERADVAHREAVVDPAELGMPPGHGDVVEEDVAGRVPAGGGDVGVEQEPAAGVGATAYDEQRRSGGSASTAAWSAGERPSAFSGASPASMPPMVMVVVESLGEAVPRASAAPQLLQKRLSSGLSCPHCVQNGIGGPPVAAFAAASLRRCRRNRAPVHDPRPQVESRWKPTRRTEEGQPCRSGGLQSRLVGRGVEQPLGAVRLVRADVDHPALAVRVRVDQLR